MPRRLKMIVAYDGRGFAGWQSQSHRNTIQDHIERAFERIGGKAIRVLRCQYVSKDFHARLSAKGKLYRYRIWSGTVLPPFEYGRAWYIPSPLDLKLLKKAEVLRRYPRFCGVCRQPREAGK